MILDLIRLIGRSFRDAERANDLIASGAFWRDAESALDRFESCPYKSCRDLHRREIPAAWQLRGAANAPARAA